jgi:hypothetical protein
MRRRGKAIQLQWAHDDEVQTLNEFVAEEVNPLLDRGFVVEDIRIETPGRLIVKLAPPRPSAAAEAGLA